MADSDDHSFDRRLTMADTSLPAEARARRVKLILFDVDGVLTDGSIWVHPIPTENRPSTSRVEPKAFDAHDGVGISLARLAGIKCGFVTKRVTDAVAMRARDLRIEHLYMGQAYKMEAIREIMEKDGLELEEIAYVGDDIIDLPVMRVCGLAVAVATAREQVKSAAHFITPNPGGHGAARDAVEFILKAKGILSQIVERYIDENYPLPVFAEIGKGGESFGQ